MSRSRKKVHIKKDSGTTPEIRRLTRRRIKSPKYQDVKYTKVVDTWTFNDHKFCEWYCTKGISEINEKYQQERQCVLENRHSLCTRLGKSDALHKLEKREKREMFHFTKRFRIK